MLGVVEASVGRAPVTVGEGIAPPAPDSEPCVRVSTSHGSSLIRPLSLVSLRTCDLCFGASPSRVIYTSLTGVFIAYPALLTPITYIPAAPRQLIHWLSQRPWLLGASLPVPHPVDTCSASAAAFILFSAIPQCAWWLSSNEPLRVRS